MDAIVVENLCKTFQIQASQSGLWQSIRGLIWRKTRPVTAVKNLSFSVKPGQIIGYIGPNGAGKSTSVKILSGILVPDSGHVQVLGYTPWLQRTTLARDIGVVFGQRSQLWWDLPVEDSFRLLKSIYQIETSNYLTTRKNLIDNLQLQGLLDIPVRQLSLGQRMRCELAAALLHRPKLLFLDEPTIGLDATSKLAVRSFIREINQLDGVTVMLTTHDMDDIEALATRVLVINHGEIFLEGTLQDLRAKVLNERYIILDLEENSPFTLPPETKLIRREGARFWLSFNPEVTPAANLIATLATRCRLRDLFVENPSIEEIIAHLYRETPT